MCTHSTDGQMKIALLGNEPCHVCLYRIMVLCASPVPLHSVYVEPMLGPLEHFSKPFNSIVIADNADASLNATERLDIETIS